MELRSDAPLAVALVDAIQGGDLRGLTQLLAQHAELASSTIRGRDGCSRTGLHVATDWPGYFPNGPAVVELLIDAGADANAPVTGARHAETPLHWAASTDDVEVAAALLDRGADVNAPGASIAGGGPLDDAVGYGCWHVARLLVERGARVDALWQAAALGMQARVEELLARQPPPTPSELNAAFWQSCHGGQRRVAQYLLARGADINAVPGYTTETPLDIAARPGPRRATLRAWLLDHGATSSSTISAVN